MRRLTVGVALILALAGCSSPPATVPAPSSMSDVETLGVLRADVCKTTDQSPWAECVDNARAYLRMALQIHTEMETAGTATQDMTETVTSLSKLLVRCAPPNPTEANTKECTYTFDTIRATGLTFQQQIVDALGS